MSEQLEMIIVDDELRVTQALEREIRLEFGTDSFAITCFNNPIEALAYIQEGKSTVFLVISDLRMPEINGSDLLQKIRLISPEIQTILLTAYTDIENIQKAVSASIQSLLFKPWTQEGLVSEVFKALKIWTLRQENKQLNSRIDDMLRAAGEFQKKIFSTAVPRSPAIKFSINFKPFELYHCGGDFYEILDAGKGCFMILLGDVTGHGPKSSIIAGMFKIALQAAIESDPTLISAPDLLLKKLNTRFCTIFESTPDSFIAITALYLDTVGCTLSISTAGLPPAIHIRNGNPELLTHTNSVLGVFPDVIYTKTERFILPGDHLILYTDGLVESVESFFKLPFEILQSVFSYRKNHTANSITEDFQKLLPGQIFTDDITVVSIEILGEIKT